MKSPFFLEAKEALRRYLVAKRRYQRIEARAEKRLEPARPGMLPGVKNRRRPV